MLSFDLFPWQRYVVDVAGEYDPATRIPCFRTVGVGVSRQNGKTTLVCARIARQLIAPRQTVAYTAQDRGIAYAKWAEHVEILMSTPFADRVDRIDRTNHQEMMVLKNGSRYMPVTPSAKKAARSFSVDLAVMDEAHAHDSMEVIGALEPTMATRAHAQMWLLSNAGDERSVLWKRYTTIGRQEAQIAGSRTAWFEWCPMPGADVADRDAWADGNPSLGHPGGVLESALESASTLMDPETFRKEHLNLWADSADVAAIDPVAWAACRDDDVQIGLDFKLALDITPERDGGGIVAVGQVGGRFALEVLEHSADLEFLIGRTAEIAGKWRVPVVIDRSSPASSVAALLTRRGIDVELMNGSDAASAAALFHDAVAQILIAHRGDYRMNDAVAMASQRRVGDRWVWQRRGAADITLLTAATSALWGVISAKPVPRVAVY